MFIGALVAGILTTVIIELIHKKSRVKQDAAIGIAFSTLFAIGVILISLYADKVDLDQECVLYGEIAFVPLAPLTQIFGHDAWSRAGGAHGVRYHRDRHHDHRFLQGTAGQLIRSRIGGVAGHKCERDALCLDVDALRGGR